MVSFILVTAVLAQAVFNVTQSGYMRRRAAAIHAAEAGLNWYSNLLERTPITQLSSTPWTYSGGWWSRTASEVASYPDQASFTIKVKYTAMDVCKTAPCSADTLDPLALVEPLPDPAYAIVRSIGVAKGVTRVLESAVRLHANHGGIDAEFGAIGTSLCFDSAAKFSLVGSIHVLDLPSSVPSGFPCTSSGVHVGSGDELNITGSLLIDDQGLVVDSGGKFKISGDVWAEGSVMLGGSGGNIVDECGSNVLCVDGDAIGSSVTIGSGAVVLGDLVVCNPACPPTQVSFPKITDDSTMWTNWQPELVADGAEALSKIGNATSQTVFIVQSQTAPACNVVFDGPLTLNADVAIVSHCGFRINGNLQADIQGVGKLSLVSAWPDTGGVPDAAAPCTGKQDIEIAQNPTISRPVFLYTPCLLTLENNQSPLTGQFVARFMFIKNEVNLTVSNSLGGGAKVPGPISGFSQDIRYIKEIVL